MFEKILDKIPKTSEIISFILNPTFTGWFLVIKIIFIIVSFFFLGFIIFALIKSSWLKRLIIWDLKEFLTYQPFELRKVEKQWKEIRKRLDTEMESEWKLAVIDADKILEDTLSRLGISGKNLEEKMTNLTSATLPNIEEVKEAHKIRNNIVYDPAYKLSLEEAKKAVSIYEKSLIELHAL